MINGEVRRVWQRYIDLDSRHHVGVASAYTDTARKWSSCDWLKPYLLLFDKVLVDEVGSLIYNSERESSDTYQWLLDQRVVDQYPRCIYREIDRQTHSVLSNEILDARQALLDPGADLDEKQLRAITSRWEAQVLSDFSETNAVSVEKGFAGLGKASVRTSALRLVAQSFPVPFGEIPFQDILQLRAEEEFMAKRAPLRNWCRKLGEISYSHIQDELASQLADYQEYLRIQKVKCASKTLEIIACAPAGLLEDLLKLRFEKAFSRLFRVSEQRLALAEAELKAPGRELALLVAARERLS